MFSFPTSRTITDELLGSTILRVIGSHWRVVNWADEPLPAAVNRCLQLLNERAFVVETGDDVSCKLLNYTFVFIWKKLFAGGCIRI